MNTLIDKLPHKPPARLLESVVAISGDTAVCTIIRDTHPSIAPSGQIPAAMGLEIIAQAAAVWLIHDNPNTRSEGMLVQCRDLVLQQDTLNAGEGLTVTAQAGHRSDATSLYQFGGWIKDASGRIVCSATLLLLIKQGGAQ
jgi:predicted hotdog family 3-hydroxylacyl-ACP dehydratase